MFRTPFYEHLLRTPVRIQTPFTNTCQRTPARTPVRHYACARGGALRRRRIRKGVFGEVFGNKCLYVYVHIYNSINQ